MGNRKSPPGHPPICETSVAELHRISLAVKRQHTPLSPPPVDQMNPRRAPSWDFTHMFRAQRVFASSVEGCFKPRPTCQLRHLLTTANRLSMPAKLQGSFKTNERPIKTTLTDSATFEEDQQIHGLISSLPLVRYLRSTSHSSTIAAGQPKYTEFHLHSNIHPSAVSTHLVSGSLLGQSKLPIRPRLFVRDGPTVRMIAACYIGSQLCGHPGYVHGGLPFVLFDDLFARCASMTFDSGVGMTANMDLQFRKPSIPDRVYIVRAEVMKREGRKVWLSGSMRCLDSFTAEQMAEDLAATGDGVSAEEEQGSLVVEASSLFVEPKFASAMVPLFQNE